MSLYICREREKEREREREHYLTILIRVCVRDPCLGFV